MTIRTRLTLWYGGFLFGSVILVSALFYSLEYRGSKLLFEDRDDYEETVQTILWYAIPTAVFSLGAGWWLMRKALSPVEALIQAAEQIHEGNLHHRLPRSGNGDELDRLTDVFNLMTARLDTSFQRVR
jgi:nitrogen fixation/metabolism regulation signal transduction histidine kinase